MGPRESEEEGADNNEGAGPSFRAWVGAERGVRAGAGGTTVIQCMRWSGGKRPVACR